jgi:hypothetical protein
MYILNFFNIKVFWEMDDPPVPKKFRKSPVLSENVVRQVANLIKN